jgi:hypothetical protein
VTRPDRPHPCPGGCGQWIARSRLSCPQDWYRLPKPLRDEITAAYKRRKQDRLRHTEAVIEALKWYQANPVATLQS